MALSKQQLDANAICAGCHGVTSRQLGKSVHATKSCRTCHGPPHAVEAVQESEGRMAPVGQIETCGKCHDDVLDGFRTSVHGEGMLKSGLTEAAPSCSDCHGSHSIQKKDDPRAKTSHQKSPETCGSCHELVLEHWRNESAHGALWSEGKPGAQDREGPGCTTCHVDSHSVRDPTSAAMRQHIPGDCGGCHQKGDEDRISLLFEINRINNYATRGCAVVCHVPAGAPNAKEGKFGTATDAEKGDLWHWKAARSDPAGYADDGQLVKASDGKTGRKGDAGKGGDKQNLTADKSKPMYMLAPGKKLGKNGFLLAADAVEISDYSVFKAGDVVTSHMPVAAEGSFGDIKAVSRYADGARTVILSRKMDTGHDDDVAFDPRKKYNFTMALFDDSKDYDSYDSEALNLDFKK